MFFSLCPFYLLEQNGSSFETLQTFNISSLTNNLRICLHLKSARRMNMHQYYTNIHHRLLPLQSISTSFFALKTIYHIHQILEIDIFNLFFYLQQKLLTIKRHLFHFKIQKLIRLAVTDPHFLIYACFTLQENNLYHCYFFFVYQK